MRPHQKMYCLARAAATLTLGLGSVSLPGCGEEDTRLPIDGGILSDSGPTDCGPRGTSVWEPRPHTSWQWQLEGEVDESVEVDMIDIDLFDVPIETIRSLESENRVVICYFSAGSREDWRSDADDIPVAARGLPLEGWPGEVWVDTRDPEVRSTMERRLDLAVEKGCRGVEPDNVDAYRNPSGFDLGARDQLDFNRFLSEAAHERGLSIGLKNDLDQIPELVCDFDWALNEECFDYDECEAYAPFLSAGKAVFHASYGDQSVADRICPEANAMGIDAIVKNLELDAWRIACW